MPDTTPAKSYARVQNGAVFELFSPLPGLADLPISAFFHPDGTWVDVTSMSPAPQVGWIYDSGAGSFSAPPFIVPSQDQLFAALDVVAAQRKTGGITFQASAMTAADLFATDTAAQQTITSSFVAAGAGLWTDGTPWQSAGGFTPFTAADVQALARAALGYIAACQACQATLHASIAAGATPDLSAGWPANGPFSATAP